MQATGLPRTLVAGSEEEEKGTCIDSDVVKAEGEEAWSLATPGCRREDRVRRYVGDCNNDYVLEAVMWNQAHPPNIVLSCVPCRMSKTCYQITLLSIDSDSTRQAIEECCLRYLSLTSTVRQDTRSRHSPRDFGSHG